MARPLYLCEVLEQEHAALYGETLAASWEVEKAHVKKPHFVAQRCRAAFDNRTFSPEASALAKELTTLVRNQDVLSKAYKEIGKRLPPDLRQMIANDEDEPSETAHLNRRIIDEIAGDDCLTPGPRARLEKYFDAVHERKDTSALCLSGGGIRSATFALGVLQALASHNLLDKFDYISTVSGGGYIGSWLSSWIRRHPKGLRGVAAEMAARPTDPLEPQAPPVAHLREYSNFLTPRLGMWSGDTWAVVGTYIRNLLLNWTVLIPLMLLLVLLPRITAAIYFKGPLADLEAGTAKLPVIGAVLRWIAYVGGGTWIVRPLRPDFWLTQFIVDARVLQITGYAMLGLLLLGVAVCYLGFNRPANNRYQGRKASTDTSFIWWCAMPLTGAALVLCAAWIRYTERIAWARANMTPDNYKSVCASAVLIGRIGMAIMILIPIGIWIVNVINYYRADSAARRENVAAEVRTGKVRRTVRKLLFEGLAAAIAGYVSYLLLLFLTKQVFPHPVRGLGLLAFPTPVLPLLETAPVAALYVCFGVPLILMTLFISATIFVGLSSAVNEDYDREWWARCGGWVLAIIVAWPVVSATVIFGPVLIWFAPKFIAAAGGTTAVVTIILGRSSKTGQRRPEERSRWADIAAKAFAPAVILLIFSALSLVTSEVLWNTGNYDPLPLEAYRGAETVQWHLTGDMRRINGVPTMIPTGDFAAFDRDRANGWHHIQVFYNTSIATLLAVSLACIAVALFGAGFIGVNKFSMHAMYRNRLIRAYLGASRATRDPNPFTGFDQHDNLSLQSLRPELLWMTSFSDFHAFYAELCTSNHQWIRSLREAVNARRSEVLTANADDEGVREALFQVLNCVLEEEDFSTFAPEHPVNAFTVTSRISAAFTLARSRLAPREVLTTRCFDLLRKNRITFDQHFAGSIHPFNEVLLVADDISDRQWFEHLLTTSDLGTRLLKVIGDRIPIKKIESQFLSTIGALNNLMQSVSFAKLMDAKLEDVGKLVVDPAKMKEPVAESVVRKNREILEKEFQGAIFPYRTRRPIHLLNAALNLVSGNNLAWQERKAETFTFSPLHAGSYRLGYRPTVEYGGQTGVTLGTAMTISGAAASPNMGYHTSAPLALLMTLFNVRLGWWLGNPGAPGKGTFHRDSPRNALMPLIAEATGKTNDTFSYVYLSDGGHFENLGLYEMVLRRRRYIIVSDAGCDPKFEFEDLGNAIRKIRTDLGVPIEMDEPMFIGPSDIGEKGKYCATGRIRYSAVDGGDHNDGYLLYVKPAVYALEPKDIYTYFKTRKGFPHESTADQFFTESQFESYRMLGRHVIDQIVAGALPKPGEKASDPLQARLRKATAKEWKARSIEELFRLARHFYLDHQDGAPANASHSAGSRKAAQTQV